MLIEVLNRNVPVESATREWIERRVQFALGRFIARICRVVVIVDDINGPRGGNDQRCRLRISLIPEGSVVVGHSVSLEGWSPRSVDREHLVAGRAWRGNPRQARGVGRAGSELGGVRGLAVGALARVRDLEILAIG